VLFSKYRFRSPLYQVQQELARADLEITRTTLADWVAIGTGALEPLFAQIRKDLVGGDYLQVDETPVRVMDPEVPGKTAQEWLWVYARPGRDGPERMLKDFLGTFQSDGYGLYEAMERDRKDLRRVACWAHKRQMFHEALEDDVARARELLVLIAGLYLIEKETREGANTPKARKALRREKAPALLYRLHCWRLELEPGKASSPVLLKSPLGKAIRYTLGQWEGLVR
jgi:transposase